MLYVPAGQFDMGSDDEDVEYALQLCKEYHDDCNRGWFQDEQPVHTVVLDAFWIDRTEVTNAQFAAFVDDTGYVTDAEQAGRSWARTEEGWGWVDSADWQHPVGPDSSADDDHPVVQMSWNDAVAYCEWAGARLPTEAEWEYAARGGQGYAYPWGDEFDCSRGNFDDERRVNDYVVPGGEGCDGYDRTAPVGSFPAGASWCGALDLAGNTWEWVADWYDENYYERSPAHNPLGPEEGDSKVLRGESWLGTPVRVRCTFRYGPPPAYRLDYVGFRCARGAD